GRRVGGAAPSHRDQLHRRGRGHQAGPHRRRSPASHSGGVTMAEAAAPIVGEREPLRQIGLYAATAITVGNIIGSGIFRSPHSVAQHLHAFPVVLFAWVLGGVLSICGSLVLAELAVTHPRTGGLYVYIREAFG